MSSIFPMTYAKAKITPQHPIGSGFGDTTAAEVIRDTDLSWKTAIVTGGYSSIGLETTRTLVSAGAKVVVPGRDLSKATSALQGMPGVTTETLDLMDPVSIDAFANRFVASGQPLHILLNNAGKIANPLRRDARGYESQSSTNHLGHFQLTARLWPALRRAKGARVVSLPSILPQAVDSVEQVVAARLDLFKGASRARPAASRQHDETHRSHCYGEHK